MTTRQPVALSPEEIAAVRSWVVHEDAHVLALAKPSGLSSQGGRIKAHTLDDLLWAFARSNGKRPELVHRLDRDTSGVILAAKTKPAAGFLVEIGQQLDAARPRFQLAEAHQVGLAPGLAEQDQFAVPDLEPEGVGTDQVVGSRAQS